MNDSTMDRVTGGFRRAARGQATVETALGLTVLLMLILGFIDLGRAFFMNTELTQAVNEGARYATFNSNVTSIQNKTIAAAPTLGLTTSNITVTCYSGSTTTVKPTCSVTQGDTVKVTATTTYTPVSFGIARLIGASLSLSATSRGTYQ